MAIGLGKRYWVRLIKFFVGSLEECIEFMQNNKPKDKYEWYELDPIVNVKEETAEEYKCSLVEMDYKGRKRK